MRNTEERIRLLRERAEQLQRRRDRRLTACVGAVCLMLFFGLVGVIRQLAGQVSDVAGNSYTGSSLLSGRAGGYVLLAVVAFWAGVLVAVLLREYRRRTHKNECGGSGK